MHRRSTAAAGAASSASNTTSKSSQTVRRQHSTNSSNGNDAIVGIATSSAASTTSTSLEEGCASTSFIGVDAMNGSSTSAVAQGDGSSGNNGHPNSPLHHRTSPGRSSSSSLSSSKMSTSHYHHHHHSGSIQKFFSIGGQGGGGGSGLRSRTGTTMRGNSRSKNSSSMTNVCVLGCLLVCFIGGALLFLRNNDTSHHFSSSSNKLLQTFFHHKQPNYKQPSTSSWFSSTGKEDQNKASSSLTSIAIDPATGKQTNIIDGLSSSTDGNAALMKQMQDASTFPNTPLYDTDGTTRLHVVFSTDCSAFQHWQSYLLFYSAWKVGQPGRVTRIASGCTDEERREADEWHKIHITQTMAPGERFGIHFTPKFTSVKDSEGKEIGNYKFFNKPLGLKHWMEYGDGMGLKENDPSKVKEEDVVVILIDPDMILLRPISSDFSIERETIFANNRETWPTTKVKHGYPFAQKYGLGIQWQSFDLKTITSDENTPALAVSKADGRNHYPVGPPYIATARDMYQIATKWTEFAPKVHAEYPFLLAEMYAYCIAAAHLQLPHKMVVSGMISNVGSAQAEAWSMIDKIPALEVCPIASTHHTESDKSHSKYYALPNVMHYCQRYMIGEWFFSKRKQPKDFFTCSKPLMAEPPSNIALETYQRKPPGPNGIKTELNTNQAKRNAFMVCGIIGLLNSASTFYKSMHCGSVTSENEGPANFEMTLTLS